MRATVCQLPNDPDALELAWEALVGHVRDEGSELVVLPEMPFSRWLAASSTVDPAAWKAAVSDHERWCTRMGELGAALVVGSRPVTDPEPRNRAFARTAVSLADLHDKVFLPNEEGFWEATWYRRGEPNYSLSRVQTGSGELAVGTLLCTEMWFLEHSRAYGRDGAHVVAVPRATPRSTLDKWIAGGRTTAVVSGAYCLSSVPYTGPDDDADLGGGAWIIDPEGELVALTDSEMPFATATIDLDLADAAKSLYPRYVPEATAL